MKKFIALLTLFVSFVSCELESDTPNVTFVTVPVESVVIPDGPYYIGDEIPIEVNYLRQTNCHNFDGFIYERDNFTRNVAIQNYVVSSPDCMQLNNDMKTEILRFSPTTAGTYLFRFWKGRDTNGQSIFEEHTIEVLTN